MTITVLDRFRCRRGTASALAAANEVPLDSEIVLESDTGLGKIGDGVTHYNDLLYKIIGNVDLSGIQDGYSLVWDATNNKWKLGLSGQSFTAVPLGDAADGGSIVLPSAPYRYIETTIGGEDLFIPTYKRHIDSSDPHWADVVSLTYCDGMDGSATLADEVAGQVWTVSGGATLKTANNKFGSASFYVPNTSGAQAIDSNAIGNGIAAGDFCFDVWLYRQNTSEGGLFTFSAGPKLGIYIESNGQLRWWENGNLGLSENTVTLYAWTLVSIQRSSGVGTMWINGVKDLHVVTSSQDLTGLPCKLGNQNNGLLPLNGYMDGWRATKAARYTANFSVPTTAWPNHS